jgi:hypothetical protein
MLRDRDDDVEGGLGGEPGNLFAPEIDELGEASPKPVNSGEGSEIVSPSRSAKRVA